MKSGFLIASLAFFKISSKICILKSLLKSDISWIRPEKLGIENQRDCLGYRIAVKALERIADHIENIAKSYIQLIDIQKEADLHDFISTG